MSTRARLRLGRTGSCLLLLSCFNSGPSPETRLGQVLVVELNSSSNKCSLDGLGSTDMGSSTLPKPSASRVEQESLYEQILLHGLSLSPKPTRQTAEPPRRQRRHDQASKSPTNLILAHHHITTAQHDTTMTNPRSSYR